MKKNKNVLSLVIREKKLGRSIKREKEKKKIRKKRVSPILITKTVRSQLINAGLHIGDHRKRIMSSMNCYVIGNRHSVSMIDLVGSIYYLRRGLINIGHVVKNKMPILCVLSRNEGKDYLSLNLEKIGHYGIKGRYIPGTISNYRSVNLMKELPGVVCIADTKDGGHAIKECMNLELPYFGLCDSDMEPSWFCYPVFGNNDSVEGSRLLVYLVYTTIELQERRLRKRFLKTDLKWKWLFRRRGVA